MRYLSLLLFSSSLQAQALFSCNLWYIEASHLYCDKEYAQLRESNGKGERELRPVRENYIRCTEKFDRLPAPKFFQGHCHQLRYKGKSAEAILELTLKADSRDDLASQALRRSLPAD